MIGQNRLQFFQRNFYVSGPFFLFMTAGKEQANSKPCVCDSCVFCVAGVFYSGFAAFFFKAAMCISSVAKEIFVITSRFVV